MGSAIGALFIGLFFLLWAGGHWAERTNDKTGVSSLKAVALGAVAALFIVSGGVALVTGDYGTHAPCRNAPGPIYVGSNDPYGLDGDGDGMGCESGGGVHYSGGGDYNCNG